MKAYLIRVECPSVRLQLNGQLGNHGFYKNEYVWARDEDHAISKAKTSILSKLKTRGVIADPHLTIDEACPVPLWNPLFCRQGFIFFPAEDDQSQAED